MSSASGTSPEGPLLRLGLLAGSSMENERRLPIHPRHLERIDADLRSRMILETGYGEHFSLEPGYVESLVGAVADRETVLDSADVLLLPKPQAEDLLAMPRGRILWGWPHCVQDPELTQIAIDRRLTLIAFEAMDHGTGREDHALHVFHRNNEMAGYCSVQHALQLLGITGTYGQRLGAVVIGFGATARGAVTALAAQGVQDIHILTQRGIAAVGSMIPGTEIVRLVPGDEGDEVVTRRGVVPLQTYLAAHDVIVNCTLQDVAAPRTYLRTEDLEALRPGSLIVDVSCDEGMGFDWARPTTFEDPVFTVGTAVSYYAVDHSPSYLWDAATWEISEALLPFLRPVMAGPSAWSRSETLSRAIEIREGTVVNPRILEHQERGAVFPHDRAA